MWIDPTDGARLIVANDGGLGISLNRSRTWERVQFPNAQIYHVTTDNRIPYNVYGNRQDGPSFRGASNSLVYGYGQMVSDISRGLWMTVGGGESGWTIADPADPNIIWSSGTGSGSVGGSLDRYDERTRQYRSVEIWPDLPGGSPANELKYRFHWTFPVAMSPHDHNTIYAGSQHLHRTADGGQSWQVISPDLTLNDKSRQRSSGGLTGDNIGVEYAGVVMAIAESPKEAGVIWVGTNDGLVQVTRDGGKTWTNVTANIPNLPAWGTIYSIEASRHSAGTAYIAVDLHQENNRDPFVYRTSDYGKTWKSLAATLPRGPLGYAHCIAEDPVRPGLLFLGTENAIYVSFDAGDEWQSLQNDLPHAPVYGITVQEHFSDLVIATYGRGFWILDDITPLRQMTPAILSASAHLFTPRPAYRFRGITPPAAPSYDPVAGENPPYGADLNYYLKSAPDGDVRITILDDHGRPVRTLPGTKHAGINRVWWDLTDGPGPPIRIRTAPMYAPWVRVGPEGRALGGRSTLLAPPGRYAVKLSVGGQELTQPLTVIKDPHSAGTEADIRAQVALLQAIRGSQATVGDMINQVELVRKQLGDLGSVLQGADVAAVKTAAGELDRKLIDFEENLFQIRVSGGQDGMRWPAKLVEKLRHLASGVQQSDFAPTAQQIAVHQQFAEQIKDLRARYEQLLSSDIAGFNAMLREKSIPNIVVKRLSTGTQ